MAFKQIEDVRSFLQCCSVSFAHPMVYRVVDGVTIISLDHLQATTAVCCLNDHAATIPQRSSRNIAAADEMVLSWEPVVNDRGFATVE